MTNLELIRQKCIEANPEKPLIRMTCMVRGHEKSEPEPIRLADVLLAIEKDWRKPLMSSSINGHFTIGLKVLANWNLRKDSLEEQSEETLQFLADLLR